MIATILEIFALVIRAITLYTRQTKPRKCIYLKRREDGSTDPVDNIRASHGEFLQLRKVHSRYRPYQ